LSHNNKKKKDYQSDIIFLNGPLTKGFSELNLEHQLIKTIKTSLGASASVIGDDCAVINMDAGKYLFCLDNFNEGTHFSYEYFSAEDIGWKSLAVNLSDIAAHAGEPLYILVGLSLSSNINDKTQWVKDFYQGLNSCAQQFGQAKVIGGDITASQSHTSISVAVIGKAAPQELLRSLAKPGDKVFVSGKFGNSASFLAGMRQESENSRYHLRPEPRLNLAKALAKSVSSAALMDASDGLAASLLEIARQSRVDIGIEPELIPKDSFISIEQALYGGEDYELVACSSKAPEGFIQIGQVTRVSENPRVFDLSQKLEITGTGVFRHFSE
jgi:thiamine-monophosphate kinase